MKSYFRVIVLTAVALGFAAACSDDRKQLDSSEADQLLNLPILPATDAEKKSAIVNISCTETIPSTAAATLTWTVEFPIDNNYRIDLTIGKDGFDQNRYATLWPLKGGQQPRPLKTSVLRQRPVDPALRPRLKSLSSDARQGLVTVTLEDLYGGLLYYVRLVTLEGAGWVPGPAIRVDAPVCITERFDQNREPLETSK